MDVNNNIDIISICVKWEYIIYEGSNWENFMYCINYVIKNEDTLYRISRHFNVTLQAIMEANPFVNIYELKQGTTIRIPVSVPEENYINHIEYTVKENDTLGNLLDEYSINMADFIEFNKLEELYLQAGMDIKIPIKYDWEI